MCWFCLRVCLCAHVYSWAMCAHRQTYWQSHSTVYITIMFALPSGLVKLFVQCSCPFSYCLLLSSSFNFWLDGLYKNCIYDNVWLSFTREYITVIRDAFPSTKILNRRPQILTVPVLSGIFHYCPCSHSEIECFPYYNWKCFLLSLMVVLMTAASCLNKDLHTNNFEI